MSTREKTIGTMFCSKHFLDSCPTFEHPLPTFKILKFDRENYIGDFDNMYSPPYRLHVVPVSRRNTPLIWRVPIMESDSISSIKGT